MSPTPWPRSVEQLCERVDIDLVRHSGIYAWFPDSRIESVYCFINYYYPRLVDFFALAARDDNIVLLSLD